MRRRISRSYLRDKYRKRVRIKTIHRMASRASYDQRGPGAHHRPRAPLTKLITLVSDRFGEGVPRTSVYRSKGSGVKPRSQRQHHVL
jgi:hypothetical protein